MADVAVDVEDENILTSIFKDAFPESWQENPEFVKYLVELSSYGVQKLAQEPDRLSEEKAQILEEIQDLAFHNYTTFIQTATCSKEIFQDFQIIEQHLDDLLLKLPTFSEECNKVLHKAQDISSSRRMNTLTLQRHTQLLEVLEMPQLMDTCVRNGYYEEALELAAHVRRLEKKHSNIPVIMSMVEEVKQSTQLMLGQLIQQLRSNLQLPACLRVIGYLRRMEVFTEPELRIKFLQARDSWFQSILDGIPKDDAYTHITKTIEVSRVHLFDIMTQFRAIFSDEDPILSSSASSGHDDSLPDSALFHSWVVEKVAQFLSILESDLKRGVGGRLDSLLGQCMYFGLSFSRVGADFRALLAPIFHSAALSYFQQALKEANVKFEENMQSYNLLGMMSSGGMNYGTASQGGQLYPPTILLDFYPLAAYCNHVLMAFNDLRLCAPVNLVCHVVAALSSSLHEVNHIILAFHRAEETTFNQRERAQFEQLVGAYMTDLLPYLNRCLQALFPPTQLSHTLGLTLAELQKMGNLGMLDLNPILQSVQHLIPVTKEEPPSLPPSSPILPPSSILLSPQGESSSPSSAVAEQTPVTSSAPLQQEQSQETSAKSSGPDSQPASATTTAAAPQLATTSDDMQYSSPHPDSDTLPPPSSSPSTTTTTAAMQEAPSQITELVAASTASTTLLASSATMTDSTTGPEETNKAPNSATGETTELSTTTRESTESSVWLQSEEIDLDNMPDAWMVEEDGEGELSFLSEGVGEEEGR